MFLKTSFLAFVLLSVSPAAMAAESLQSDREIHGRSVDPITANLADYHGIAADQIEAWGDKIVVYTTAENGANRVLFVDKDTLRPLANADAPAVASRVDVVQRPVTKTPNRWSDEPARSLLDSDDDGSNSSTAL